MQNSERVAKILVISAIASLFFRRGIFHPYFLQPFEFLIILAFVITIISLFFSKRIVAETKKDVISWLKFWGLFFLFLTIGLIYSYFFYHDAITKDVIGGLIKDYFALLTNALAFLMIIYYSRNPGFIKQSLNAFLSSFSYSLFVIFPSLILIFNVTEAGSTFIGFHNSRTALASLLIISFAIITAFFVKEKNMIKKIIFWVGVVFIVSLILWAGSRAGYLALATMAGFIVIYLFLNTEEKLKLIFKSAVIILSTVIIAYLILPLPAKNMIIIQIFPQFSYLLDTSESEVVKIGLKPIKIALPWWYPENPNAIKIDRITTITTISNFTFFKKVFKNPNLQIPEDGRQTIWSKALKLFIKNPLGLSTQFYNIDRTIMAGGFPAGAHNTFLQVGLSGGWLGFILFGFLIYKVFYSLKNSFDKSVQWLALTVMNFGFLIALLVDDRLFNPWLWVIISLAIGYHQSKSINKTSLYNSAALSQECFSASNRLA